MTREDMFDVLKSNVAEIIEGAEGLEIKESHSMRDFAADSLEVVEVVARSMKQMKLKVGRDKLLRAESLGDLLDIFEQAANRSQGSNE